MMFPHITIEEINSLTEDEQDMLLYLCNIWAPIRPPMPSEDNPHPITLNLIRIANRHAILDRVIQACNIISEEGKPIYNSLREKLGIPNPPPPEPTPAPPEQIKEPEKEILNGPTTGSNVQ